MAQTNKEKQETRLKWRKKNMKTCSFMYKKEFVDEFNEACAKLNINKSRAVKWLFTQIIEESKRK